MFSPIIDVGTSVVLKLHLTCIRRVNIPVFVIDLQQTRLSMQSVIDYPLKKTKFDDNYSINYTERPFTRPLYSACYLTSRSAGFQNYCFWSEEISQKTNNGCFGVLSVSLCGKLSCCWWCQATCTIQWPDSSSQQSTDVVSFLKHNMRWQPQVLKNLQMKFYFLSITLTWQPQVPRIYRWGFIS
jgi:hypothetical protein